MTREDSVKFAKEELAKNNLKDWHIRLNLNVDSHFLGLCSYRDKCIIISGHHIDLHPDAEIKNTIRHEIAHALTPGMGHNEVWSAKAREIGCDNTLPCSNLSLRPEVIDAIRSGATVEVEIEEQVIRTPKFKITRLQDRCPECNAVAKEKFSFETIDKDGNEVRMITLECYHIIKKIIPRGTPFHTMVSNDWKDEIKNCKHEWDKNQCVKCREFKLFDFQVNGCRKLEAALSIAKGGGCFDEMGLGKTIQGIGLLKFHPDRFPALFVVKSSLKFQFFKELIRWLGPEYLAQVIETSKDYIFPNLKCYIISYDLLRRLDRAKIEELKIKTVIMDECQQIKNADSSRTQQVRRIVADPNIKVIALSGTPWKNRGSEFFPVLNMLDPTKFGSFQGFLDRWVEFYYEGPRRKEGGIKNVKYFKEYVEHIIFRRERADVMKELPLINRVKLHVQLDEIEQTTYNDEVSEFVKWYNDFVMSGEEDSIDGLQMLAKMSRMRHITGLAKIPATVEFVEEFIEDTDRKLVIFIHHKDVGQLLYDELVKRFGENIPVMKITAELSSAERFEVQEQFNKLPRVIMVASTLASGEGLNLQSCADCIMHERQWNPANEEQAEGRFIRIGQTSNTVNGTYVEAEGTIDEHLDIIIETKRRSFHAVMNDSEAPIWNQSDIGKELASRIVERFNKDNKKKNQNLTKKVSIKK